MFHSAVLDPKSYDGAHPKGGAVLVGAAAHDAAVLEQVVDDGRAVGRHLGSCLLPGSHLPFTTMRGGRQRQPKYFPACGKRCYSAEQRQSAAIPEQVISGIVQQVTTTLARTAYRPFYRRRLAVQADK